MPEKKTGFQAFMVDFAIGGVSGAVTKTAMNPVERVKMLMQTQDSNPRVISGEMEKYKSIPDCFKRVNAEEGFASFWKGNFANCLRYAPQQGSALAFNDAIKGMFPKADPKKEFARSLFNNLMAGGTAGAMAMIIAYPLDFARTRLATQGEKKVFNGIWDCIATTVRNQGITGLYRGTALTVTGAFVYRAGQLGLFGTIMGLNPYKDDKGAIGFVSALLAATAARSAVLPFNYPFDTVRRRLMLESEVPAAERTYKSGAHCAKEIMKNEGLAGMYKGVVPEIFRGLGGSIVIVAYDRIKNALDL